MNSPDTLMRTLPFTFSILLLFSCTSLDTSPVQAASLYDFTVQSIEGDSVSLSRYENQVLLVVNVASQCGYTPQYRDLEKLFKEYRQKGFAILAFPANNFGGQEPGTNGEIKDFCERNYGVTFDLFSKISVLGTDQHPLYKYLTSQNPEFAGDVKWNFEKFLISRDGRIVGRFRSAVKPFSEELIAALERAIRK
jgi:glutathione peroxidase